MQRSWLYLREHIACDGRMDADPHMRDARTNGLAILPAQLGASTLRCSALQRDDRTSIEPNRGGITGLVIAPGRRILDTIDRQGWQGSGDKVTCHDATCSRSRCITV